MPWTDYMYANTVMVDTLFWDAADTPAHNAQEAGMADDGVILLHEATSSEYVGFRDFRSTITGLPLTLLSVAKVTGVRFKHETVWSPEPEGGGGG